MAGLAGSSWVALLTLMLFVGSKGAGGTGGSSSGYRHSGKRTSFGFRVQARDFQPTFRRSLLRNSTMPLHGAVKDYG